MAPSSLDVAQVENCTRLLEQLHTDRSLLSRVPLDLRRRLIIAAGKVSRPDKLEMMKLAKAYRRSKNRKALLQDRQAVAQTIMRETRRAPVYVPPALQRLVGQHSKRPKLNHPRACYVCKTSFDELHFFYDAMCTPCGDFNYAKRFQTAPLDRRVALITGSRLKIGYQAALMMLRAGAKVIATTRFAQDAALRFSRESDYGNWAERLEIHGLDLRHSPSVELFCEYILGSHSRLDILINNAAQTVRRPPGFYRHLLEWEQEPYAELPAPLRSNLHAYQQWKSRATPDTKDAWVVELATKGAAIGICAPALMSQLPLLCERGLQEASLFPVGMRDADSQQIDLRKQNSWRMKLADVPTSELIEVQLVNAIAPFILCSKLKPLMLQQGTFDRHIVNVSAMEGKFTRYTKTDKHPHTNMAKAALNMMTLTSAPDYAKDGIFMNAVDTGWVTDEDPALLCQAKQAEHDFQPPLDIVDGAARVCDPFFSGLLSGKHVWGKFLKDYASTTW